MCYRLVCFGLQLLLMYFQTLMFPSQYFWKTAFEEYLVRMVLELTLRSYVDYKYIKCTVNCDLYVACEREDTGGV